MIQTQPGWNASQYVQGSVPQTDIRRQCLFHSGSQEGHSATSLNEINYHIQDRS